VKREEREIYEVLRLGQDTLLVVRSGQALGDIYPMQTQATRRNILLRNKVHEHNLYIRLWCAEFPTVLPWIY